MKKQFFAALVGALGLVVACGGGSTGDGGESSSGGEDLTVFEGPVSGDAAAGATVFATYCEGCHPGGGEGAGPDLHETHLPAHVRQIVRQGDGRMPAFGANTVSDAELENLMAHLQSYGMF